MADIVDFWSNSIEELFAALQSGPAGLNHEQAAARLKAKHERTYRPFQQDLVLLWRQFKNPLTLLLIFAVVLSAVLGEYTNSFIILGIISLSAVLGFWQERNAGHAVEKLRARVQVLATVQREGTSLDIPVKEVVPGDVVMLSAGDIIPGDGRLLASKDLHVNEAALTGESFPADKEPGSSAPDAVLNQRKNCVFQGTSVVSGTASVLIVHTGDDTELGRITESLEQTADETAFESGVRNFGYMLMRVTLVLSSVILLGNVYLGKPINDSILFALALAVGMAPELLPAIVTITLSAGAQRMAAKKAIVKKLASIQNLGAVDIFCSDKTGTLTEGVISVQAGVDAAGEANEKVLRFAYLNARFETGFSNPLDEALRNLKEVNSAGYTKFDEVPYDFIRKRLSIVVTKDERHLLLTKGALRNVLDVCVTAEDAKGNIAPIQGQLQSIQSTYEKFSREGFRTIGICYKDITGDPVINKDDETEMTFLGFVVLADPPRKDVVETVQHLNASGVTLKLITGDNKLIAEHVGRQIGLACDSILTGGEIRTMSEEALVVQLQATHVFAEIEPNQKERLVRALQKSGHVVGFIGDGINDAAALKAADVGISVDTAVDVAKESADIVFLDKDLTTLQDGIMEGRKTFLNTLKYIFITTSANFGNMFSMAGASLFLPFLPLLPKQILLTNFLTDVPAMALASDRVDEEMMGRPRKWDPLLIRNFMIVFGIQSSLFDFLTFYVLYGLFKVGESGFQTGWFLESVITEIMILLIIRTRHSLLKSHPHKYLLTAAGVMVAVTIILPFSGLAPLLGFDALQGVVLLSLVAITILYGLSAEFAKKFFFRKMTL